MDLATAVTVDDLADVRRDFNLADARQIERMLQYEAEQIEASKHEVTPMAGMLARSMIALEIGQAMGLSENQVQHTLFFARTVRDRAPLTWARFTSGDICSYAIDSIALTINKLIEPESVTELDAAVGDYAATHTVAELKRWLRRFVVRVEAEAAAARAEEERRKRCVVIEHGDEGMSWVKAYVPSIQAEAIARRLFKEARKQPKDGRTLQQKQADLFASWLTTNENTGEAAVNADIGVVIDADVLAGVRAGFGESPDGAWVAPAAWIAEIAETDNPFWYRMVVDPVSKDILSIDYRGRFAPEVLKKALFFLHGTCAVPGCTTPAWKCEFDHIVPWPEGRTTAANIQPLSKAHHGQKGHGLVAKFRPPPAPQTPPKPLSAVPRVDLFWTALPRAA